MEELISKQTRASGHIIRAYENLLRVGQANITYGVIEAKISVLDAKWEAFTELHDSIEGKANAEQLKLPYFTEDVYAATEDGYVVNKGKFLDLLRKIKKEAEAAPLSSASATQQLPKISLPKFSGEFAEWPAFRDLFTSMVGNNSSLTNIEKLHYLKMSLIKEPAALIASIPLTAGNFNTAWKNLVSRYDNVRLLTSAQIAAICSLPAMKSETSSELKALYNGTVNAVSALRALGRPVDSYDDFLVYLTVQKLDRQSRREWESSMGSVKTPSKFTDLQTFLETRIYAVQALEPYGSSTSTAAKNSGATSTQSKNDSKSNSNNSRVKAHQASNAPTTSSKCACCKQEHYILFCDSFRNKSADERKAFALANNLCLNCLGRHFVRDCRSQKTCQVCKAKHHSMIHDACSSSLQTSINATTGPPGGESSRSSVPDRPTQQQTEDVTVHTTSQTSLARVLLATALVKVFTAGGTTLFARALLDQGSEASFVSESLAQRLRLPRASASVSVTGIGAKSNTTSRGRVSLTISSRLDSRFELKVHALVLSRLTAYVPLQCIAGSQWHHLKGLTLADPDASSTLRIELILGADVFSQLLLPGVRKGPDLTPVAQNTRLGWILSGQVVPQTEGRSSCFSLQASVDQSLSESLQRFWEQEEVPTSLPPSTEDLKCEEHFVSTHSRAADGRYTVRLPLKKPLVSLGDSLPAASRMLSRMESRSYRDEQFRKAYSDFLTEYEQLGHMELVPPSSEEPTLVYYLPHHGVVRESSETTKFRVVFNGSQKTSLGFSLNDCLFVGPKLLPELVDVMLRWRMHTIVFSADMEKMYRQVLLHPHDRDLQRILWRKVPGDEPSAYRLRTVTYGLACAPYLAIRVVRQLARDEKAHFPIGSQALLSDVYVDDVLSGASDVASALIKQREITELLKAGGFSLRKWTSNAQELLAHLPSSSLASGASFVVPSDSSFHMLGLSWKADTDCFDFQLKTPEYELPLTKRKILSSIAELFDPLGWLVPVTVTAKIFMQSLWLLKLDWDQPLPESECRAWLAFYSDLARISELRIPRWLQLEVSSRSLELHGFADASERAYAAVVYLCVTNERRTTTIVAAKSKVAPVKQLSLPRLELCAAHLLVKLAKRVREVLALDCSVHLWSDSTVTLAWIRAHPVKWKTFVANRVSEIQ